MAFFKVFVKFTAQKDDTFRVGKWHHLQAADLIDAINKTEQDPQFTKYGPALATKAEQEV